MLFRSSLFGIFMLPLTKWFRSFRRFDRRTRAFMYAAAFMCLEMVAWWCRCDRICIRWIRWHTMVMCWHIVCVCVCVHILICLWQCHDILMQANNFYSLFFLSFHFVSIRTLKFFSSSHRSLLTIVRNIWFWICRHMWVCLCVYRILLYLTFLLLFLSRSYRVFFDFPRSSFYFRIIREMKWWCHTYYWQRCRTKEAFVSVWNMDVAGCKWNKRE